MKKYSQYLIGGLCLLSVAFSAGSFMKVNAASASPTMPAQPVDLTFAAEKALPAVVHIRYVQNSKVETVEVESDPFSDFFGDFFGSPGRGNGGKQKRQVQTPKREATGSGVIISADGYIVTNNHVVEGADQLTVTLNDNREFSARIIGTDKSTDLALIKIDGKNLPTLPIGDSDKLKVGEWVLAVGNPFNLNSTVTAGIVSAKARTLGGNPIESFIQTDAAINQGNSGGALVNTQGELVGINTMIYSQTGNYAGYSFAVPINSAAKVVADIKKFGSVQRAVLGIGGTDVTSEIKEKLGLKVNEGVVVTTFAERSGAFSAGMEEHDVITAVDGKPVKNMAQLQDLISIRRPGDKVEVTVNRKGSTKTLKVTLKNEEGGEQIIHNDPKVTLGAQLKALTNEQKRSYGVSYGVAVAKVGDGKFKEAGIKEGFIILSVNNKPVRSVEEARRAITQVQQSRRGDGSLLLKGFYPNGRTKYYVIDLL